MRKLAGRRCRGKVIWLAVTAICLLSIITNRLMSTGSPIAGGTKAQTAEADITNDVTAPGNTIDLHILGSKVSAWLNPTRLADNQFQERVVSTRLFAHINSLRAVFDTEL